MTKGEAIAYGSLCLIWSTTWLAIRVGVRYLPPLGFAGLRFLIASILLVAFLLVRPVKWRSGRLPWASIALAGVLQFVISYGLVFWGEQEVTAGFASLAFASGPLFVALFARVLVREPLEPRKLLGVCLGFVGIFFLFLNQFSGGARGFGAEAALVVASMAAALANVIVQRSQAGVSQRLNATIQMLIGTVFLLSLSLLLERQMTYTWNLMAVVCLLFLAIFGSAVAFVLYYWLVHRQSAMKASTIAFVAPVLTVIQGHFLLGETLGWNHLMGGVLVIIGSGLVVTAAGRTPEPALDRPLPTPGS